MTEDTPAPQQLTAGQLTSAHLGRQVVVEERLLHSTKGITGTLAEVRHGASQIDDGTFADPGRAVLGRGWVKVEMLNHGEATVSPGATVELLD